MAMTFTSDFEMLLNKPIDTKYVCDSLEELLTRLGSYLYVGLLTYCKSDNKYYSLKEITSDGFVWEELKPCVKWSIIDYPYPSLNYVDLGLTSDTLWADKNIGAETSSDYGYYYAWGETDLKEIYYEGDYKWINDDDAKIKYNNNSTFGNVDNKTTLDLEDDVAYVKFGNNWRIPTKDLLDELVSEGNWEWTTMNGMNGFQVTGPNGNSIFLPASGYFSEEELHYDDEYGYYWTSDVYEDGETPHYSYSLFFEEGRANVESKELFHGCTIRPVYYNN